MIKIKNNIGFIIRAILLLVLATEATLAAKTIPAQLVAEYAEFRETPKLSKGQQQESGIYVDKRDVTKTITFQLNGEQFRATSKKRTNDALKTSDAFKAQARQLDAIRAQVGLEPDSVESLKKIDDDSTRKLHIKNSFEDARNSTRLVTSSKKTYRRKKGKVSVSNKQKMGSLGIAQLQECINGWHAFEGENFDRLIGCGPLNKIARNRWGSDSSSSSVIIRLKEDKTSEWKQATLTCKYYQTTGATTSHGVKALSRFCINQQWGIPIVLKKETEILAPGQKEATVKLTALTSLNLAPAFSARTFDMQQNQVCNEAPAEPGRWAKCRYKGEPRKQDTEWINAQ